MTRRRTARAWRARHVAVLLAGVAALSAVSPAPAQVATAASATVLDRAVARGQVLADADFTVGAVSPAQARSALRPRDVVGMEAARPLAAGATVRPGDVQRPQLIRRGEQVLIVLGNSGLRITSVGRALGNAAAGEPVRVVANATNRTLDAVADAPGAVHVPF